MEGIRTNKKERMANGGGQSSDSLLTHSISPYLIRVAWKVLENQSSSSVHTLIILYGKKGHA